LFRGTIEIERNWDQQDKEDHVMEIEEEEQRSTEEEMMLRHIDISRVRLSILQRVIDDGTDDGGSRRHSGRLSDHVEIVTGLLQTSIALARCFAGHFSIARLNAILFHGDGSSDTVQLVVETTSVAYRLSTTIAPPESGIVRVAIDTNDTRSFGGTLSLLRFDQRSTLPIHLMIQSTSIAEIMSRPVSSPQRGTHCSTIDTFSTLRINVPLCILRRSSQR